MNWPDGIVLCFYSGGVELSYEERAAQRRAERDRRRREREALAK